LVEAEDFDEGPEGVAFHNVGPVSNPDAKSGPRFLGLQYRNTPVELAKGWGTTMITAIRPGEWWKYLIQVDHEGIYDIEVSASRWDAKEQNGKFSIEISNSYRSEFKSDLIEAPLTGEWYLFKTVIVPGVKLKKGIKTMKVMNDQGNEVINLDSFRFVEHVN
jgi:hypothetical protein